MVKERLVNLVGRCGELETKAIICGTDVFFKKFCSLIFYGTHHEQIMSVTDSKHTHTHTQSLLYE